MYVAVYAHGTLISTAQSKLRSEEKYRLIADTANRSSNLAIVRFIPRHIWWECSAHAGRFEVHGYPCLALSMQSEAPEVPHGWPIASTEDTP